MDLDQWISKVKDGQHLSEDELQLLCEYVRLLLLLLLRFFVLAFSSAKIHASIKPNSSRYRLRLYLLPLLIYLCGTLL